MRPPAGLGEASLLPLDSDERRGGSCEYGRRGERGGGLSGVGSVAELSMEADSSPEVSSPARTGVSGGVRGIEIGAWTAVSMRRGGSLGAVLPLFELDRER